MAPAIAARTRCPGRLATAIRGATARHADWQQTAELVAGQLRAQLRRHLSGFAADSRVFCPPWPGVRARSVSVPRGWC